MKAHLLFAAACLLVMPAHAQERTAAGNLDTQMTWSALSAKVAASEAKTEGVNARVDQIEKCGGKGKVYAPGKPGADTDGCLGVTLPEDALARRWVQITSNGHQGHDASNATSAGANSQALANVRAAYPGIGTCAANLLGKKCGNQTKYCYVGPSCTSSGGGSGGYWKSYTCGTNVYMCD